ncbi:restriction endonuclease subunit S [Microbacterium maritypicum]|uniref:restriction endonuclease subunit S n=1 Tax=Microbacterium maritypicum TaxID=33918 RepID=UPI003D6DBF3F
MNRQPLSAIAAPRGLVGGPFGSSLVNADYTLEGVPVIRGANMSAGRFIGGEFVFVSPEKFTRDLSRNHAVPQDIIYTQRGTLGQVALVPRGVQETFVVSQSQMRLRVDPNRAVPEFVYYASTTADFLRQIEDRAISTGVPHTNLGILAELTIPLPPLAEQQAIAEVLGALDDKIAANASLASTADELSLGQFQSFLRDGELAERATADVATVVLGGTPSKAISGYWTNGTVPWLNSGELNATRVLEPSALITEEALSKSAAKMMPPGATLIAITGATLGQIARLEIAASGNQSIVGVWSEDPIMSVWLYFALRARRDQLLTRATGAAQQHVSKADVAQLQIPVPSRETLWTFGQYAIPLLNLATNAERESIALAATRDALLPHLMSDKLRVRDAESAASAAGL